MRIALMSDIHANREAFEACFRDVQSRGFDRLVFLVPCNSYSFAINAFVETYRWHVSDAPAARLYRKHLCSKVLGDYVGYGADPVWVVDKVMELVAKGAIAPVGHWGETPFSTHLRFLAATGETEKSRT